MQLLSFAEAFRGHTPAMDPAERAFDSMVSIVRIHASMRVGRDRAACAIPARPRRCALVPSRCWAIAGGEPAVPAPISRPSPRFHSECTRAVVDRLLSGALVPPGDQGRTRGVDLLP